MGSLFDGIGGFPLAAVHNGITPAWASEIEAFPMEVTKIRFPGMLHVGDITKLDGGRLPPVDVICGGSPCQDLSVAGKRQGLAGERSGLFMEQVRIVKEMREADGRRGIPDDLVRPRYLVWENVPGAFSSAGGEDFRAVIEEIVRIKDCSCHVPRPDAGRWGPAGAAVLGDKFSLAWRVLDAQFWGVAQRRRRIFLVADFGGLTAHEILFKQDSLPGNPAAGGGEGQGAAAAAEGGADGAGGAGLTDLQTKEKRTEPRLCLNDQGGERMDVTEDVAATLRAGMGSHQPLVAQPGEGPVCPPAVSSFHVNQRDEVIDLGGISGALMATRNMQMQTFVAQQPAFGVVSKGNGDCFLTPESHTSLTGGGGQAGQGYPCVLCLNDQGGSQMHLTEDKTGTLRAQEHGHQPLVFDNHGQDSRFRGPVGISQTVSAGFGMGGNNQPLVLASQQGHAGIGEALRPPAVFSLDSKESNSMKSSNPYSGCRETDTARTIDTTNPDPSKNQGGIAILQETFCIAGNIIDRQPQNGGNGFGYQQDISYTLTAMDHHAVFSPQDGGQDAPEGQITAGEKKEDGAGPYQELVGALCRGDEKGIGNQYVSQDKCIVEKRNLIRRLTPLECERLQGFPDGWTDIPGASDSARYKALGNSVAIPCVDFVLRGIAYFLRKREGRGQAPEDV
ncbi:DNA cytosine methyltransferase [Lachnospiraceae bacterium 54-11]|uniref:DNA cytosine methyltransferase n=1 Tax=uncultured Acetatifactor sp. TaxID=1671927 RepID=UPI002603EFE0|nr:DNA cytosine methyltransferase [uncultured Acetatifactor sp.]